MGLDAPDHGAQAINDEQWPLEIKLHSGFRSRRLKNNKEELQQQGKSLRKLLIESSQRHGLVVAGYSGAISPSWIRVMGSRAASRDIPCRIFLVALRWMAALYLPSANCCRRQGIRGVEIGLVQIENFDETLRDLIRVYRNLDTTELDAFAEQRHWWGLIHHFQMPGTAGFFL